MREMAFVFFLVTLPFLASATETRLAKPSLEYFQNRYPLKNVYDKLVDNHGDGFLPLYGVRNFRAVLNGVVYRGGANNAFNQHGTRPNMNPLPDEGLKNLCNEGFRTAVYLYATNYETAPKVTRCENNFGLTSQIEYEDHVPLASNDAVYKILEIVHDRLTSSKDKSPIYLHCWNGWHASGFISAVILRQYCDYNGSTAVKYWDRNTDGDNLDPNYNRIRKKIRAFVPYKEFKIPKSLKSKVCPQ